MKLNETGIEVHKRSQHHDQKFSILIPTWNNLAYLQLCIRSIQQNSFFSHQIIIHINEGTDGTKEWMQQQNFDYSVSNKNIGVCYALNICSSLAFTDYILYMNDDMYACKHWDRFLWDEIQTLPDKFFFLSATTIEPKPQSNCSIEKNYGKDIKSFNEERLLKEFSQLEKNDWQGSTWPPNIVHRSIWNLAGGYSIEFTPGLLSDPDFSMKLWKLGVRYFKGIAKSRVYHFGSVSLKKVKRNNGYYMFIAKWRITQNTFSKLYLRRGELFDGALKEPDLSFFIKVKNGFKKFKAIFYKY